MAFNRDLSQLANFLEVNSEGTFVNIIPSQSQAQLGIGTNNPRAKLDVLGNARVSGVVTATTFVGALTGLASSATQLATGRTVAITGDLTYTSGSFDGTSNVTGVGTLANTTVTPGSYGSSTEVATFTVDSKGRITAAGTASVGTALTVAGDSGSENINLLNETLTISGGTNLTSSAASNTVTVNLDDNISLTSVVASGIVTATSGFSGNLTGNVTGNINSSGVSTVTSLNATNINALGIVTATSGFSGNLTGNVTGNINSSGVSTVTSLNATNINASGIVTATSGFSGNVTGNLTGNVTGNINSSGVSTVTSLNATNINASGIVTATSGFSGNLTGNVTGNINSSGVSTVTSLNATNINASGIVTATSGFVGNLTGTASTTTNIPNLTGDITSVNTATTLATVNSNVGSFGSQTLIPVVTVNAKGLVTAVTTASVGTALTVAGDSGSENIDLLTETLTISGGTNLTSSAASNSVTVNLDPNISLTSVVASGVITATSGFVGDVTGNINSSGVSTVTSLNATNINALGIVTATQFVTGASGSAIGINTNTISGPATITIDPAGVGDNTGLVVIKGDLQIDGTTTTINSTTVTIDDKNIQIADGAANDAAADGAGFTITSGDGNKTFQFQDSGDNLGSSENLNVASGKVYKVNNTEVLSSTTLGSGVINSSLTSVGTLTNLSVGNVNSTGIITATSGFSGNLTGNVTGNINSSGVSTVTSLNATNINASGIVTATSGFVGNLTGLASSATQLQTGRTVAITGDLAYTSGSFDGTSNVTGTGTLATVNSNVGSFGSQTLIPVVTVNAKGLVTAVTTASVGTALTVAGDSGSENIDLLNETLTISGGTNLTSSAASNSVTVNLDPNISLTSVVASGIITATSGFSGNLTGNINSSGVSTVTSLNATNINASGIVTATTFAGALTGTATSTTNIPNLTGAITSNNTTTSLGSFSSSDLATALTDETGSGSAVFATSPTLVTPVLGSATATSIVVGSGVTINASGINALGIVTATSGFSGNLTGNINSSGVSTVTSLNATNINTSGIVTATSGFVGALTGLASSATQLATGRTVAITGDLTYTSGSFDGTSNVTGTGTLATVNTNVGSFGSQTLIPVVTVNAKGLVTAVTTASVGTALTVAGDSGSENIDLLTETLTISGGTNLTSSAASNSVTVNLDPNISLTSVVASGVITATSGFSGNLTGNVTGNINSSGVSTVTSLNATNINALGIVTATQFVTGASGSAIGINTNTISGPATITIDPAGVGDNTGLVVIKGDLQIDGTTTTVNSTTITVDDKNLLLGSGAANDAAADGGGITLESGEGNKTFNWVDATDSWTSSEHINALTGKVYKINGTEVLSSTTLGSGVVNSSLTSVGTLTNLNVGNVNSTGIVTATTFVGALTGNVTGNINSSGVSTVTNLNIGGYVSAGNTTGTMNQVLASVGAGVTWKNFNDLLPQTRTGLTTTATAAQTLFNFAYNVNFLDVFVNGVKLSSGEFTATNGNTITLSEAAFANDTVEFVSYATLGAGTGQVSSLNDLTDVTISGIATGNLLAYNGSEFVNTSNINVTGIITATSFVGALTGTASSTTNIPNLTGDITSVNAATTLATVNANVGTFGSGGAIPTITVNAKGLITGVTTTAVTSGTTITDDTSTNGTRYLPFTSATSGSISAANVSSTKLTFNPSTGALSATDFNSTSDINLKENIRQVESASELVSKLEGVHFSWKETGKETIGVIAQQIEEHLPQLVQTGETHKTVNYNGLIGVLIEAVKEQGAQIVALQAEIEELKK
jgi:hypothetical protein